LRALHFLAENGRVADMLAALKTNRLDAYFNGVLSSGRSSFCYLQNVYTTANVAEQGLSLALCLCESLPVAAFRVHGGGFAGTIQAYVAQDKVEQFRSRMDAVFGDGSCRVLHIRTVGATRLEL
jgi:galactokinase